METETQIVCEKCGRPATCAVIETTYHQAIETVNEHVYVETLEVDEDGELGDRINEEETDGETIQTEEVDCEIVDHSTVYLCDECDVE
jgi:hypothetical protein